jgi:nucleoid-associated protein YgaU
MTSDAKIGLLLGLVFIFIIAFVINGLPRFRSAVGNNGLTKKIVDPGSDSFAIGERERRARDAFDRQRQLEADPAQDLQTTAQDQRRSDGSGFEQTFYQQFRPVEDPDPILEMALNHENPDNVRYTMPLTQKTLVTENTTTERPAYLEQPTVPAGNVEQTPVRRTESAKAAQSQTYTVQEGDGNLSNIAKKFYGEVEGNKLANINRIFEANRRILKSADEIFVGQKLLIPPLPASTSSQEGTGIFSNSLFEQVKSIGQKTEPGRWYVVKENDSLWKIAAEQLGNGNRYLEIKKLNTDIIINEDEVDPGMRLRLPAR